MVRTTSWLSLIVTVAACGGGDSGPPPLAEVSGSLKQLAINDTSLFAIDTTDSKVYEIGLDGTVIGKLPTTGAVSEVAAAGNWVAWVEVEGSGKIINRRVGTAIESMRTFAPHIVGSAEGLFYSDTGLVAIWTAGSVPERIATSSTDARVIAVDASFAYMVEADTSVTRYPRLGDTAEILQPTSMAATVKDGQLAHRTAEGIRLRDLLTGFDRVVGAPPAAYPCELLIAADGVLCGKYHAINGMLEERLRDPLSGYVVTGTVVHWVRAEGGTSELHRTDLAEPE